LFVHPVLVGDAGFGVVLLEVAAPAGGPTQSTDGRSTCFCGASLTIGGVPDHVHSAHLETA
jgi:hypothetical protein